MKLKHIVLLGALVGCTAGDEDLGIEDESWGEGGKADVATGPLQIVEVGDDFIEVQNTTAQAIDADQWVISFGRKRRKRLTALDGHASLVQPGQLLLIVSTGNKTPPDHGPVVAVDGFLAARQIVLRDPGLVISDRFDAGESPGPGLAVERTATGIEISARGPTPGIRNFSHDPQNLRVMFTDPINDTEDHVAEAMKKLLGQPHKRLHGAFYQVNNLDLANALVAAHAEGADVGMVTDESWYFNEGTEGPRYRAAYGALEAGGIPVVWDATSTGTRRSSALMHSKFLVMDDQVWTGSYNLITDEDAGEKTRLLTHADNVLVMKSSALAALHEREYQEMFANRRFGTAKKYEDRSERQFLAEGDRVWVDGASVETMFAPKYKIVDAITREITNAKSSVYFAAFSFYQSEIGAAVAERFGAGLDVRGVFYNASIAGAGSQYPVLTAAGVDARYPDNRVFLHHKFFILDYGTPDARVLTGSFNFSNSAQDKNDEAFYIVRDPWVAEAYYRAFRTLYDDPLFIGINRKDEGKASIAITEVYAAGDSGFVELENRGTEPVVGAIVVDRDGASVAVDVVPPGVRVVVPIAVDASDPVLVLDAERRMLATFDEPRYAGPGQSLEWTGEAWTAAAPTPGR